jgi:hypothetical protein
MTSSFRVLGNADARRVLEKNCSSRRAKFRRTLDAPISNPAAFRAKG